MAAAPPGVPAELVFWRDGHYRQLKASERPIRRTCDYCGNRHLALVDVYKGRLSVDHCNWGRLIRDAHR